MLRTMCQTIVYYVSTIMNFLTNCYQEYQLNVTCSQDLNMVKCLAHNYIELLLMCFQFMCFAYYR